LKVVAPDEEPCVLPGKEAYEAYMALAATSPNWRNQVSIESLEQVQQFDPVSFIDWIAPTALLLITAEKDSLIPVEAVREAHERAWEPKALSVLPIRHFELYDEPWLSKAASVAIDWFKQALHALWPLRMTARHIQTQVMMWFMPIGSQKTAATEHVNAITPLLHRPCPCTLPTFAKTTSTGQTRSGRGGSSDDST
jgi:hypothetical protein